MNNLNFECIFFIGPQGSGKGTQARLLAEKLGFFHWEMGAILREEAKQPNEFGQHVKDLINSGHLLADEQLFPVIEDRYSALPETEGIIFDGLPRRLGQAEFLLNYLAKEGKHNFATIHLNIPFDVSVARLLERAHHEFRKDDTEEGIRTRLALYERETLPVLDFLKTKSTFFDIDGTPSVEKVTKFIDQALGLNHES